MRILTSAFAALLLSTTVSVSADLPQSYGAGSHQCSEITQVLAGKGSMTPDVAMRALENFSAGYLSGTSQEGVNPATFARGIAQYCQEHPNATVIQAARRGPGSIPHNDPIEEPDYGTADQGPPPSQYQGTPPSVYVPGPGTLWLGPEYGLSPRDRMIHIPPPPVVVIEQQPQVIYAPPPPPVVIEQPQVVIEVPPPPPPQYMIPAPPPYVPDGRGGSVPFTNSRVMPDGSLRPYNPAIDGAFYYPAY
jgi:hypothetical protein